MTAAPSLFTRHRRIALGIAADYRVPGMEPDDVRQEALLGLWEAARAHDPARGPFPPFARTIVERRCVDLLRAAGRLKQRVLTDAVRDEQLELVPSPDVLEAVLHRARLREALANPDELTAGERRRRSWRESKRRQRARAAA